MDQALGQAQIALQGWCLQPAVVAPLQRYRAQLHQVAGGLRMVEFTAQALLAEALEHVSRALLQQRIPGPLQAGAGRALSHGTEQLAAQLHQLRRHRHGDLAALMAAINALRAILQRPQVSESALFQPTLPPLGAVAGEKAERPAEPELRALAHRMHRLHRQALAALLRDDEPRQQLTTLARVASHMVGWTEGRPQLLWQGSVALCEVLLRRPGARSAATDWILRQLGSLLAAVAESGTAALEQPVPSALLNNLLFALAVSGVESRRVRELAQRCALAEALVERAEDGRALQTLVGALRSLAAEPASSPADWLRVTDGLALLNLATPLAMLRGQALRQQRGEGASPEVLSQLADALEHSLARLVDGEGRSEPCASREDGFIEPLQASRRQLTEAGEALAMLAEGRGRDGEDLAAVSELLCTVGQELSEAGLARVAAILARATGHLDGLIKTSVLPTADELDALAEVVAGIEHHLGYVGNGGGEAMAQVLARVERAVESLPELPEEQTAEPASPTSESPTPSPAGEEERMQEDGVDPEIAAIFIEEAEEVQQTLAELLPAWRQAPTEQELLTEVRRGFHTLKGSGRMVEAAVVAELAWAVEKLLNRLLEDRVEAGQELVEVVGASCERMPTLVAAFAEGRPLAAEEASAVQQLQDTAEALAEGRRPPSPPGPASDNSPATDPEEDGADSAGDIDPVLLDIFAVEAQAHLGSLERFLEAAQGQDAVAHCDELQRALHTLKGSAHMAGLTAMAAVVTPLERLVRAGRGSGHPLGPSALELLARGADLLRRGLDQLRVAPLAPLAGAEELGRQVDELVVEWLAHQEGTAGEGLHTGPDLALLEAAMEALVGLAEGLADWEQRGMPLAPEWMAQLREQAEALGQPLLKQWVAALQAALEGNPRPEASLFELARAAVDGMADMLDRLAAQQHPRPDEALLARLEDFAAKGQPPAEATPDDSGEPSAPEVTERMAEAGTAAPKLSGVDGPRPEMAKPAEPQAASALEAGLDSEILEIFLDEAEELLEGLDEAIHGWQGDPGAEHFLDDLQRLLHTLKGGARLAGLTEMGNLGHNFETLLIQAQHRRLPVDDALMGQVLHYHDQLTEQVEAVRQGLTPASPGAEPAEQGAQPGQQDEVAEAPPPAEENAPSGGVVVPFQRGPAAPAVPGPGWRPRPVSGGPGGESAPVVARRAPQEMVRVPAPLLESLVNLAGETSIARARSEEQVSELALSLDEMQITVERLQEQVRRMDQETEAQILFRQEQVESEGLEGFDPLEFDRYSQLQQLSRSLLESASDLLDIRSTLSDKSRDMEQLLIQQSRINTELQEGLMRSRMVPFSRQLPRLRRMVRQAAAELGKQVEFVVDNAEGELDRSVLEKMTAPLEHMLRNAIDHGIESPEQRQAAGKPATGTISLSLAREGGEVVLVLTDDGGGVDLEAVRRQAEERGLVTPEARLSDQEVLQFILQAGFSTAREVTQISGRGIGMDVVTSEIRQLGGSVEIHSRRGQGCRFTVRLPFTVSVNRALMVQVAGDSYAVPLNTIEGIVRVSPLELEAHYQPGAPPFEYAGQSYDIRYLGQLLRCASGPDLERQSMPLPVLLVRGAQQALAVQVDGLQGSREIVVKTLGPQFAQAQGLAGATVLGDGSVVVILDLPALIRAEAALQGGGAGPALLPVEPGEERPLRVMVVDDSVTVRKVSSRFLERQGFEVLVARDGLDAVTQLEELEVLPDILLLDIEMPRMDGFEVAQRMGNAERLRHIPIIMITSRTGDKHRQRARALGVDDYLGKPYQEAPLLASIYRLTGCQPEPLVE